MSGANQSQLDVIHQLEEQTAEIDDGIGLLQRKIGATEQIAQTVQQELAELTESAEARHTSMMTRIMKNSTAGVKDGVKDVKKSSDECAHHDLFRRREVRLVSYSRTFYLRGTRGSGCGCW